MIEDLHTAYWEPYGGGLRAKNNFFSGFLIDIIDDMSFNGKPNYSLKHADERLKIYKEEGFPVASAEIKF
jgi:hypothetical protein